uniref:Medium-chain acyl-CoA ligase ACSF2, mitochondrial n=1 Tax=Timema poppense TaxID=170557 RepID=A0A7R9H5E0_TIMPO|nr:unnamed protein product [Timema poppensis]
MGLNPGDVIALWGYNSSYFYQTALAAARAGLILAKVDPSNQAPELRHCLNKVGAKLLIAAETDVTQNYYKIIHTLAPELDYCVAGQLRSVQLPELRTVVMTGDLTHPGTYHFDQIIKMATPEGNARVQEMQSSIQPDDGTTIHYTSGTTGSPKGALLSHRNVLNNSYFVCKMMTLNKTHRLCLQMQCCHVASTTAAITGGLHYGFTTVLPSEKFNPKSSIKAIIEERCTAIIGTPAMFVDVVTAVKELGVTISGLEIAMIGGTNIPELLARQLTKVLAIKRLCPVYGMTEGLYFFVGVPESSLEETFTTVGKAMQYVEFKAVDKEGKMVPMGSPGELWARGYIVMLGYWGDEAKTRETITADGWLKTGDQVILQENGHCRIVGRIKEAIIRGSDNIFPKEIEDLFINHPDIVDAQVFGVPDARWGEEICLYIRPRKGSDVTEEHLKAYCKGKVAEFRIPRYIRFLDDFPRNTTGKVDKKILKEQFLQDKEYKELKGSTYLLRTMDYYQRLQGMGYSRPSYWFETGSEPLLPITLGQLIEWAAEEYADKEVLVSVYENVRWTFKEAKEKADKLAAVFLSLGLNPGDVIAVWGFNSSHSYLTSLAAARAGLILAKVDPSYQAPELRHCLNKVGAKLLIAAETYVTQNYYQIIHSLAPELEHCAAGQLRSELLPELRTVVMTGDLIHP